MPGADLQMRRPGTSFADKNSVQRLAGDALQGLSHITTFNLPQVGQVLNYVTRAGGLLLARSRYGMVTKGPSRRYDNW